MGFLSLWDDNQCGLQVVGLIPIWAVRWRAGLSDSCVSLLTLNIPWVCETLAPESLPRIWLQYSCSFPTWGFSQLPFLLPWEGADHKGRAPERQEEPSARGLGLAQSPDEFFCHFVKLIVSIMPEQNNLNSAPTEHWQSSLTIKRSHKKKSRHWTTD